MFSRKYGALFLFLAVVGVVSAVVLLKKKMEPLVEQHATTQAVDLGKKYNSAYRLYKEVHLLDYPDCTQAETLEAEAKSHAQYELDRDQYWQKLTVLANERIHSVHKMLKIYNRRLPGFRPYYKKIISYMNEDNIDKRIEDANKLTADIRNLKDRMRKREKRRLQILMNPLTKQADKIQEKLDALNKQEPVEPEPEHTHKHSVELYILRHRMKYPDCRKHAVVRWDAQLDTQWHIDMEKWQNEYNALSAEQDKLMSEGKRYSEKMREVYKGLTFDEKKAMETEVENWSQVWRKKMFDVSKRREDLYERHPTKPQTSHYHY